MLVTVSRCVAVAPARHSSRYQHSLIFIWQRPTSNGSSIVGATLYNIANGCVLIHCWPLRTKYPAAVVWLLIFYSNYPINVENDGDKNVGTNNDRKTLSAVYLSFVDRGLLTKIMPIKDRGISLLLIALIVRYIHYDHHKSYMR